MERSARHLDVFAGVAEAGRFRPVYAALPWAQIARICCQHNSNVSLFAYIGHLCCIEYIILLPVLQQSK
jgi:hypothetical protein